MLDDRKKMGIFIVGAALIILIAIAVFVYIFNKKNQAATVPEQNASALTSDKLFAEAQANKPKVNYTFDPAMEAGRVWGREDVRKMAMTFASRFGSYSNQGNYTNFQDLEIFMTDQMKSSAQSYVASLRAKNNGDTNYHGFNTTAVSADIVSFDDSAGSSEILVTTQRVETIGTGSPRNFNQNIKINLKKIDGQWLVDAALWQ
jgi:hypothetical protein